MATNPVLPGDHTGGCQCGAIRYRVVGEIRGVLHCHCGRCRKSHGHSAAYTAAAASELTLTADAGLRWFRSADPDDHAERGFCSVCGGRLFWRLPGRPTISIAAGSFDDQDSLHSIGHIFVADKPAYYEIADGLPRSSGYSE